MLYNTFSAFGQVLNAKVMHDDGGAPRGFGFVNFASFEVGIMPPCIQITSHVALQASDAALAAMDGQYLCSKPINVSYAYMKDGQFLHFFV